MASSVGLILGGELAVLQAPIFDFIFVPLISMFIVGFMTEASDMYPYDEVSNHWV